MAQEGSFTRYGFEIWVTFVSDNHMSTAHCSGSNYSHSKITPWCVFSSPWLCQQRYTVAVHSSLCPSIHNVRFLGNRCMDPGEILWADPYPPYLQNFSLFLTSFSLTYGTLWEQKKKKKSKLHSYNFHLIWGKLYDKWGSHWGIKSYKCFGDLPKK